MTKIPFFACKNVIINYGFWIKLGQKIMNYFILIHDFFFNGF